MFVTWCLTVFSDRKIVSPICRFVWPVPIDDRIWRSRSLRAALHLLLIGDAVVVVTEQAMRSDSNERASTTPGAGQLAREMVVHISPQAHSTCARLCPAMATLDDAADWPVVAPADNARVGRRQVKTPAVSKVELDADGRVVAVLWGRVDTSKNAWASAETVAPVAEAVQPLHQGDQVFALFPSAHGHVPDRQFVVVDHDDGRQTIALDGAATHAREVHDMDRLDGSR
jgi:hypothetical protein